MRNLVAYFVSRPLMVNVIVILVLFFGTKSLITIRKEGFPSVSQNKVIVTTFYPGASPSDVELNVTVPIEQELQEVSDIKEILSTSQEGVSTITVVADDDASPIEFRKTYDDIDGTLSRINDLPRDIDGPPTLRQINSDDIPVIELAVSGEEKELKAYVGWLENQIRGVNGVSNVELIGMPDDEVHISVDPRKLKKWELGLSQIAEAIRKRNIEGSGGTLESFIGEKKIVSFNKFNHYTEVLETILRRSFDGRGVLLKDVADLRVVPEDVKLSVFNNGAPGASLMIKKSRRSDVIQTVDAVKETVQNSKIPDSVRVVPLNDQSKFTRNRLRLLGSNALMGMILVVSILFLIFDRRTAMWTAFGVPFSILGVFAVLPGLGVTLNAITLGGFVLVLGVLVDDAIVVTDQINKYKEQGLSSRDAAVKGVHHIWQPVFASSITTIVAFSPLLQLGGLPGKFVWIIPLIVLLALSVSLFESYFVLPTHLAHGRADKKMKKKEFVVKIERAYSMLLKSALKWRYGVMIFFYVILAGSLLVAKFFLTKDPFPQDAAEGFTIQVTQPIGTSPTQARGILSQIEKIILAFPDQERVGLSTRLGTHSKDTSADRGTQSNLATLFVYLTPLSERSRTAEEIMVQVRQDIQSLLKNKEDTTATVELIRFGPPVGRPFEIRIASNQDAKRDEMIRDVKSYLSTLKGVYDVNDDRVEGKREINLKINYKKLAELDLTVEDVISTIRIAFDGQIVSDMVDVDKTLEFRLRLNREGRSDLKFVQTLSVLNAKGRLVPIRQFATLEQGPSQAEIRHVNGRRTTTVFGQLDKKVISPEQVMSLVSAQFPSSSAVDISFSGEPVENKKIFGDLAGAGGGALLGIFLVIALIFNSFSKPIIVMMAIPFGLVGIVFALLTHGMPMSMFVMMALIGLMGIIVNDSIVMVFTIINLQQSGGEFHAALQEGAVSRLRPILLTTLTTVLGLLPTAYALGGYDPFISPMCLAMGYGLLFSTVVVLFLVPILFAILQDFSLKKKVKGAKEVN